MPAFGISYKLVRLVRMKLIKTRSKVNMVATFQQTLKSCLAWDKEMKLLQLIFIWPLKVKQNELGFDHLWRYRCQSSNLDRIDGRSWKRIGAQDLWQLHIVKNLDLLLIYKNRIELLVLSDETMPRRVKCKSVMKT